MNTSAKRIKGRAREFVETSNWDVKLDGFSIKARRSMHTSTACGGRGVGNISAGKGSGKEKTWKVQR